MYWMGYSLACMWWWITLSCAWKPLNTMPGFPLESYFWKSLIFFFPTVHILYFFFFFLWCLILPSNAPIMWAQFHLWGNYGFCVTCTCICLFRPSEMENLIERIPPAKKNHTDFWLYSKRKPGVTFHAVPLLTGGFLDDFCSSKGLWG